MLPAEEEYQGVENTDFVLYVSAVETERCRRGLTVAYASHCQQESALDRAVSARTDRRVRLALPAGVGVRQVTHPILYLGEWCLTFVCCAVETERCRRGLTVAYASHCQQESALDRDENGEPLTERRPDTGNPPLDEELQIHKWSDRVVKNITRKNWMIRGGYMDRTFHMIVTPRVVKENEAMTGTHTQNSVFSRITFALMEDTGWYRANYEHATPLDWGRNLGCKFSMASCKQWLNTQRLRRKNPAPFCERIKGNPLRTECSPRRTAVVLCNLVRHDNILPRAYQHFDTLPNVAPGEEAHYGGSVSLADYCPYLQEFTWRHKSVLVRGSRCSYEENTPKTDVNFALENYGAHSKCFDHSDKVWEQKSCRQVGNYSYTCYHAGQVLQVRIIKRGWLHKGGVVCPPCRELCGEEFASRNEYCKGGEEPLPPNLYPNDILVCKATHLAPTAVLIATILISLLNYFT
ncbi:unnamed protein product [Chrysodeixis includens]|uniref:Leishmanolysin-like peptidase n=1 Tax=Chrysodeixis includens TaxID=689277 RepID=A0A9N8Q2L6_CHRIL|nr:unnamed protein product [Chrysodeixis includens]